MATSTPLVRPTGPVALSPPGALESAPPGVPTRGDWWASAAVTLFVATVCSLLAGDLVHWFMLPVIAVGVLVGADIRAWARGGLSLVDAAGVIALLAYLGFFLAPILHVSLNSWLRYVTAPDDWRTWLGYMAILNLVSVSAYRVARRASSHHAHRGFLESAPDPQRTVWVPRHLRVSIAVGIAVSAAANIAVWWRFGGLGGYIAAFEEDTSLFSGTGWLLGLAESLPILVAFWLIARQWGPGGRIPGRSITGVAFVAVLALPLVMSALTGSLRGSRVSVVIRIVWVAGLYYLTVRKIKARSLVAAALLLLGAVYMLGFYKAGGLGGLLSSVSSSETREELGEDYGRTLTAVLLGDLSRADVQARVLYGMQSYSVRDYALGSTYVGAAASFLLPDSVWPDRPESKAGPGTRALYGDYVASGTFRASNIYGLGGEALLNFGVLGPPVAFLLLGAIVGKTSTAASSLAPTDPRVLLVPLIALTCVTLFLNDFDNVLHLAIVDGGLPIAVVVAGSARWRPPSRLRGDGQLARLPSGLK